MYTDLPVDLISKARARRQIALSHIKGRAQNAAQATTFRHSPMMTRAQMADFVLASRAHRAENIFAA